MELTLQAMKRVDAHELYRKFIVQQVRPDGRTLTKQRKITVTPGTIGTSAGSSIVRIGATSVVCGIKVEVAEPLVATPTEGFVVPNVDLSPLCSSRYRPGPPPDSAQVLSETISKIFTRYFILSSPLPSIW
jgi:exosome complex component RRP43